jgi:hypothetical protein
LGEREEYPYDEKTETYTIPKVIRGIKVKEIQDGLILGGDLIWQHRGDTIEFDDLKSADLQEWLSTNKWDLAAIKRKLAREMRSLKTGREKK